MLRPIFITGIGTGIGKTVISAIITEALGADYWKPIQAGYDEGTDAGWVKQLISNKSSVVYDELYKLNTPASPHIAARMDGIKIDISSLKEKAFTMRLSSTNKPLIIEGAGGILVPLNEELMVADLIKELNARVVLVSRNYLGSINHSLLTAAYCRTKEIEVAGWIFNDDYMQYEDEIVKWSGYPSLGSVPALKEINPLIIKEQAEYLKIRLLEKLVNV